MKKVRLQPKLVLHKDRILSLDDAAKEDIQGGWTGMSPCYPQTPTASNCVSEFFKCPWTLWNCGPGEIDPGPIPGGPIPMDGQP